jgi:GxxExxY protein
MHDLPPPGLHSELPGSILGAAMSVHSALGPGLLESVYEACLAYELAKRGHSVARQVEIPVVYQDVKVECGFRADLVVHCAVLVELKAVESLQPIHESQLFTYLRLTKLRLGLLINFNTRHLKDGINRRVL